MKVEVDIDGGLTKDLRLLALSLLAGDQSAADPLVDCYLENRSGGERLTPEYVALVEDTLHQFRAAALKKHPSAEFAPAHSNYWRCVQMAKYLGRQGLS